MTRLGPGRFRDALAGGGPAGAGPAVIAEVKRRSPSAGDLRPGADPARLARDFARTGAAAVSILVDGRFGGSLEDLRAARAATDRPLLAKGFFRTEDDLRALAEAGADAALVILRDLDDATAARLQATALALGMDALVEAHDLAEVHRALDLDADPIGVNARDLRTYRIDRATQLRLVAKVPEGRVVVAESGVATRAQAAEAGLAGAGAVLVGSALMRAADPAQKLRELLFRPLVKVCGLTREEDVAAAFEAGADLAGFVLAESPRRVAAPLPVPDGMLAVTVLVGPPEEAGGHDGLVQLYPARNGHRDRDGVLLREGRTVAAVRDLPWLEEDAGHWDRAAGAEGRVVLAGGLGPDNVGRAIAAVRPWCVDASRSLESSPGRKDPDRMRAFVAAARGAGAVEARALEAAS